MSVKIKKVAITVKRAISYDENRTITNNRRRWRTNSLFRRAVTSCPTTRDLDGCQSSPSEKKQLDSINSLAEHDDDVFINDYSDNCRSCVLLQERMGPVTVIVVSNSTICYVVLLRYKTCLALIYFRLTLICVKHHYQQHATKLIFIITYKNSFN